MAILQLTQTEGDAVGLMLPAALLARQDRKAGDTLLLTETADGYLLSSPSAEFEEQVNWPRDHAGALGGAASAGAERHRRAA